jgi:DNA-binding NarL/FixJ family response regulator
MSERGRVLLADDEELFLRSAADLFRREGFVCDCARDAAETVQAVERARYDVVVADINMSGNRDLELVKEIRHRFSDLPVILVTGHPSVATAITALRLAAVDYILKPIKFAELVKRVEEAIEARAAMRSMEQHLEEIGPVVEKLQSIRQGLARGAVPEGVGATRPAEHPAAPGTQRGNALADLTEQLSPREREILEAVAEGRRVGSIARKFTISPYTVRNHLKAIFRKLGVHSQVELLARLHARSKADQSGPGPA